MFFLKKSLQVRNTLIELITLFNMAVCHQRRKELRADYCDKHETSWCQTIYPIEKRMADVFTRAMLVSYSTELLHSQQYKSANYIDVSNLTYHVERTDASIMLINHEVHYDLKRDYASYSNKNFEFKKIPFNTKWV